jgi:hypothetical protein
VLSNATKRKNVAHLGAKLCFIKKLKKSFGISSLTACKKKLGDWCAIYLLVLKYYLVLILKISLSELMQ